MLQWKCMVENGLLGPQGWAALVLAGLNLERMIFIRMLKEFRWTGQRSHRTMYRISCVVFLMIGKMRITICFAVIAVILAQNCAGSSAAVKCRSGFSILQVQGLCSRMASPQRDRRFGKR